MKHFTSPLPEQIRLTDGVLAPRIQQCLRVTIPYALWENRGRTNMCVWNRFYKDPSAIRDDCK